MWEQGFSRGICWLCNAVSGIWIWHTSVTPFGDMHLSRTLCVRVFIGPAPSVYYIRPEHGSRRGADHRRIAEEEVCRASRRFFGPCFLFLRAFQTAQRSEEVGRVVYIRSGPSRLAPFPLRNARVLGPVPRTLAARFEACCTRIRQTVGRGAQNLLW